MQMQSESIINLKVMNDLERIWRRDSIYEASSDKGMKENMEKG